MTRLGPIQRDIVAYLRRRGEPSYIGPTTRAMEFQGLCWEQIEAALERMVRRRLLVRLGGRYATVGRL